jgi:hypothetical protein
MNRCKPRKGSESGQILVIVAAGLIGMIAMVGLVVDGGYAWGEQRQAQNGADAMANAGATVIAQSLKGSPKTSGDVGCAVEASATLNNVANPKATYTDVSGNLLNVDVAACAAGGGGSIPSAAQGVKASGERGFDTFLVRVVGIDHLTASANATAVAGLLTDTCNPSEGCALLPVTFPLTMKACDGSSRQVQIGDPTAYPIVSPENANAFNESIVPICSTGPGAVGWLNFGCGNLANQISNPCDVSYPLPTWLTTEPGNMNNVENLINSMFAGPQLGVADDSVVVIPINDNTCNTNPGDNQPTCPGGNGSGNGSNFYYHIPKITGFMLDRAYISGNNHTACNSTPGGPMIAGNGASGCFKGWFTYYSTQGPVGPGATGSQDPGVIGIQLIR